MNWVLLVSIAIHLTALVWSMELLRRLRDWRLAFLSLMLVLMILRRGLALLPPGAAPLSQQWAEAPALVISVMSLLAVFFLGALLDELKRTHEAGKRSNEELGERERRLQAIIETEPECVKLLGPNCALLQMNPAGLRMIEAESLDQVVGRSVLDLVMPEYRPAFTEMSERVLRGTSETLEFKIQGLRGTQRWMETHAVPYRDAAGQITSQLAITRDITERKRAEAKLSESQQTLKDLVNTIHGIVWEADAQTFQFSFVSQQAETILGYPVNRWLTEPTFWRDHIHPQDRDAAVNFCVNSTRQGESHHIEYRMLSADGREVWLKDLITVVVKEGVPTKLRGIIVDITGHKQAEEALRESQVRLQLIVNASNIGLWDWDLITNEVYFSLIWKQQLGYADEELKGRYEEWESRLHPDDREQALTAVHEFRADRRPDYEAEFRLRHKNGSWRWILARAVMTRDVEGRPIRMMGCHLDITDRKQAERLIESQRAELQLILDSVPAMIFYKNTQGRLLRINEEVVRQIGLPKEELLAKTAADLESPYAGTYQQQEQQIIRTGQPMRRIIERIQTTRGDRWMETDKIPLRDEDGTIIGVIGFAFDITERKQAEDALREKEQLLSESQRLAHIGSWHMDLTGRIAWSDEAYRIYGVSPDTFSPNFESFSSLIHSEDRPAIQAWITICAAGEKPGPLEFRIIHPDGSVRTLYGQGELKHDAENQPSHMTGTVQDITERKQAEETLLASQQRFAKMFHSSPVGVCVTRLDSGTFLEVNDAFLTIVGHSREDLLGRSSLDLNYWIDPEDRRQLVQALKEHGSVRNWDVDFRRKDGSIGHSLRLLERITLAGEDCILTILNDITERRQMEEALRESERFARATLDALSANIAILDEHGVIIRVNRAWREFADENADDISSLCEGSNYLLTCDEASGTGQGQETAFPFAAGIRAVIEGTQDEFMREYPCHSPTEQRWFVGRVTRFREEGPKRIVVSHTNVTERKQAEEARRESEMRFRRIIESNMIGILFWNTTGGINDANDAFLRLVGYTPEDVRAGRVHWREMTPPEYLALDENALHELATTGACTPFEKEYFRKDGSRVPILIGATTLADQPGEGVAFVLDITERKQAEQALRASQSMLELVMDSIPQGVFWKDRNSVYLGANRVAREASGLDRPESIVGLTNFQLPSPTPEEAAYFTLKDREVMDSNQPQFRIEETITLPDGSTIWLETNKLPMHDPEGHVIGILGTWQDITERKRTDDELRASRERLQALSRQLLNTQEAERRHIARELHDQIGQSLTAIKLNLKSIQPSPYETTTWTIRQETIVILDQTLEQVRTLSLDLRPSMLDDLGLASALRWYLDRQARRAEFSIQFAAETPDSGVSKEIETTCFRVAQEIVTNIARHAHARNVQVELHRLDNELELLIRDDGVGFDLTAARERATQGTSMGLLGMQERVLIVGGRLEIQSEPSRGTEVRVRFPLMPTSAGSEMEIPHSGEGGTF